MVKDQKIKLIKIQADKTNGLEGMTRKLIELQTIQGEINQPTGITNVKPC